MNSWHVGGVGLWLLGWWFTGRLFGVYLQAIRLEDSDRRHRGLPPSRPERHRGTIYFLLFDLGLLLLGLRSLQALSGIPWPTTAAKFILPPWSVLLCAYLFRAAARLHGFYHCRWRAQAGRLSLDPGRVGTLRGLWEESSLSMRWTMILAPLAAVAIVAQAALHSPSQPELMLGGFAVCLAGLATALGQPLARIRRRLVHQEG